MMPAPRPFDFAARSASTMRWSVRASDGSLIVSPGLYCEPSGFSQYFLLPGQLSKNFSCRWIACAVLLRIGKPFSA